MFPIISNTVWFHTDQKTDIVDGGLTSKDVHRVRFLMRNVESGFRKMNSKHRSPLRKTGRYRMRNLFIVGKWTGGTVSGIAELKKQVDGIVGESIEPLGEFLRWLEVRSLSGLEAVLSGHEYQIENRFSCR